MIDMVTRLFKFRFINLIMSTFMIQLKSFNHSMCSFFRSLCQLLLLLMTAIVLAQVFFRYGLGDALTWSEEASRFLMVWLTFWRHR